MVSERRWLTPRDGQRAGCVDNAEPGRLGIPFRAEALLDGQAEALTQKAIDLALTGDMAALRLCLNRVLPPRKDRPVTFTLPPINSAQDAAKVTSAILAAVSTGELTPADAGEISKLVDTYVKAFGTAELADRLERLGRMTAQ